MMHNMTTATVSMHVVVTTALTAAACGFGHISMGGLVSGHPRTE